MLTIDDDVVALTARTMAAYDPQGTLPRCGLRRVLIGTDEWSRVAAEVESLTGAAGGTVAVVMDTTDIRRGGRSLKDDVISVLAAKFTVRPVRLDDGHRELHADDSVITSAAQAVTGADAVVSVGGGTISDIGKLASMKAGDLPLVLVQTAASVDGFTDDVSVVLRNGVKRTIPSRWPDVVIADVQTIAEAPSRMNVAGFGEINSMFTAPADWLLAALLGVDDSFHEAPIRLLDNVSDGVEDWSSGVGRSLESTERLTRALAIRGIATGVSGSTACLSGVEHLVSHMLDLHNGRLGRSIGLHGAQVGAASVVAAAAWQLLFDRLDEPGAADAAAAELARRPLAAPEQEVLDAFAGVDPSGRIGAECWADYSRKAAALTSRRERIVGLLRNWSRHREALRPLVRTPQGLAAGLVAAAAPARLVDLDSVTGPEIARWAVGNAAYMRNRVTVLDLLVALGWWTGADQQAVHDRAEAAVARVGSSS